MRRTSALPVIYLLDGSVAVTGAFACARNIAKALRAQARVVLVLPSNSTIGPEQTTDFAAVHRLPIRPLRRSAGAVLNYLPALATAAIGLRWLMGRDRATTLIVNDFHLMQGALCRMWGFRGSVYTWVRIDPAAFGARISKIWLRLAARSSDRFIAVSRHIQKRLPRGLRTDLLYDALAELPAPAKQARGRFVFVGNYIPGKGQDHAIEAFVALAEDHPDLTLDFYGGDMGLPKNRAYRNGLSARVQALRLGDRVRLHDFAASPSTVMTGALAALNFSTSESFSMTVLEASAMGLPVIATRSGGPAEIIDDGATGFLVPPGDIEAMTNAMRALADDNALAAEMGAAARIRVAKHFSFESFRSELSKLLGLDSLDKPNK
jgi:glycosyltransferase involved in cell wall biosynthesis